MLTLLFATLLSSPSWTVRQAAFDHLDAHPDPAVAIFLFNHPDPEVRDKAAMLLPAALEWAEQRREFWLWGNMPYLDSLPDYNQNHAFRQATDDCRNWLRMRDRTCGGGGKWIEYRMSTWVAIEIGVLWPDGFTMIYMAVRTANWNKQGRWEP